MENGEWRMMVTIRSANSAISLQALGAAPSILAPLAPLRGEGLGVVWRTGVRLEKVGKIWIEKTVAIWYWLLETNQSATRKRQPWKYRIPNPIEKPQIKNELQI